jgi:UDP-glucose 4-epimerase
VTDSAWVIGASGLLGRAVTRELARDSSVGLLLSGSMAWADDSTFDSQATAAIREITAEIYDSWTIFWCAGAGVVGTGQAQFDEELRRFRSFVDLMLHELPAGAADRGAFFFASSAGGVYAGSDGAPFSENTVPRPISPYGHTKLAAELVLRELASGRLPVLVGRIANLYGPDQRLDKAQGIISQLCRSSTGGSPTSIYVSLDTLRDYLFADDCAGLILDSMKRLRAERVAGDPSFMIKVLASQQAVTIGAILGMVRSIFKRAPNARIGSSASAAWQVRDLRFTSVVWPDLDQRTLTPLPVGVHAVARTMTLGSRSGTV